jgi:hypothetical protein
MTRGQEVKARPAGGSWVKARADFISGNGRSVLLSADEGLPLGLVDTGTGRQVLLLTRDGDAWLDVASGGKFEVEE